MDVEKKKKQEWIAVYMFEERNKSKAQINELTRPKNIVCSMEQN